MSNLTPYSIINMGGKSDWLLVCEHAGNRLPPWLSSLGLSAKHMHEHIAYDIGTYEATLALCKKLDATAIVCHYSRLVIDCNRTLSAKDAIPTVSDGVVIPVNQQLSAKERQWRINRIYLPFHTTVTRILSQKMADNPKTKLANIHSFTPMLAEEGRQRPWEIGFIYQTPQPTQQIIANLKKQTRHIIGDNQPYSGVTHPGYTIPAHAMAQNIAHFLVEFRQDLINTTTGVDYWSDVLINAITDI